jgi:hypothetical protein
LDENFVFSPFERTISLRSYSEAEWQRSARTKNVRNDLGKHSPKATAKERQRIGYLTGILNKNGK